VTDELFFETDADAAQFILDHDGAELLEEKKSDRRVRTLTTLINALKDVSISYQQEASSAMVDAVYSSLISRARAT